MPPSRPDDQTLLDRLNALKPTAVTFDKSSEAKRHARSTAFLPGPGAQPASREDALAARLRTLRSQPSDVGRGSPIDVSASPGSVADNGAGSAASPRADPPVLGSRPTRGTVDGKASPASPERLSSPGRKPLSYRFDVPEVDDEDAVDELLEALADEGFDLAADEGEAAERTPEFNLGADTKDLAGFLKSFQGTSGKPTSRKGDTPAEDDDDDDSDGEQMSRAVETLLSQIGDEIKSLPPPTAEPTEIEGPTAENLPQPGATDGKPTATPPSPGNDPDNEPPLTLPTVPTQLPDPAPNPGNTTTDPFEKDITARLASLRGLGPLDALGLPSAPTFRPQDHDTSSSPKGTSSGRLLRSSKYTDADQQTWCVVCLDDATIRCVGCDSDVYCARCWKEMHVGPSAGFDERGHRWVGFDRMGGNVSR